MSVSRTAAEMANKLFSTGRTITSAQTQALRVMSDLATTSVLTSARRVVPDLNMSNVGKNGGRLGVRTTVGTVAAVKATGPWQIVEYDTKKHVIASKRFSGPRKGRGERVAAGQATLRAGFRGTGVAGAALRTPYGPRTTVRHPGTKGQHPFRDGVADALPKLPLIAGKVYRSQISKIFQ
jgi:hypothetical protein